MVPFGYVWGVGMRICFGIWVSDFSQKKKKVESNGRAFFIFCCVLSGGTKQKK